jgi:N,N'-diacetyllegionaminate synthase
MSVMTLKIDRCLVIAEAGVNHNGSLELALRLAEVANVAGADYVKYQTFAPSLLVSRNAPAAPYQSKAGFNDQFTMLSELSLSDRDHRVLKSHCDTLGIGFSSTGHDSASASYLEKLGQDFIKVGSGDITNFQLLELVSSYEKPILMSTGASTMQDVVNAVAFLESIGVSISQNLVLLQCTSAYPAPVHEANIRVLAQYREEFGCRVGFSDHTQTSEAALAAVALGASVVEKHITLDKSMPGPDHSASYDADEFSRYVKSIRAVEAAMGSPEKSVTESESPNQPLIRKSLYARQSISKGDSFTEFNVISMRPAFGLPASEWPEVSQLKAARDFAEGEALQF